MTVSNTVSTFVRRALLGVAALAVFALSNANAQNIQLSKKFVTTQPNQQFNPGETVLLRFEVFNNTNAPITNVAFTDFFTDDGLTGGTRNSNKLVVVPPLAPTTNGNCGTPTVTTNAAPVGSRPANTQLNFSNITVPPQNAGGPGTCYIFVNVSSTLVGANTNRIPAGVLTSSLGAGNTNGAIAETLTIRNISAPTVNKGFSAVGSSGLGGTLTTTTGTPARLVVRVNNTDGVQPINTVNLADVLPAGLQYDTLVAPIFSAACGTPRSAVFSSSGNAGSLANDAVTINSASLAAGQSCDVEFRVFGGNGGVFNNTIPANAITTREGLTNGGAASAALVYQSLSSAKSFTPDTVNQLNTSNTSATQNTLMRLTISNPQGVAVNNVSVTDYFTDNGLVGGTWNKLEVSTPIGNTIACTGGGTAGTFNGVVLGTGATKALATGDQGIKVTGLNIPAGGQCVISVNIRGTAGIASGQSGLFSKTNTLLGQNILLSNGSQGVFTDVSANLNITPAGVTGTPIGVTKDVTSDGVAPYTNPSSTAVYNSAVDILSNTANVPAVSSTAWYRIRLDAQSGFVGTIGGVNFTDNLPAGMTYDQLTTSNCNTAVTNLTGTTLSVSNLTLSNTATPPSNPCVIVFRARSPTRNQYVNTIPAYAVRGSNGESNGSGTSATIYVRDSIELVKGFTPSLIGPNGITRLRVQVENRDPTRAFTGLALTDNLPTGLTVAAVPNISTTCVNASSTAATVTTTATSVSISGVQLPAANDTGAFITPTICTFDVDVKSDTGTSTLTNTIPTGSVTVTNANPVTNNTPVSANLQRSGISVTVDKAFITSNIGPGNPSQLIVTINNTSGIPLTGVKFTDYFTSDGTATGTPLAIQIANPANASTTCAGGVVSATPAADPFAATLANKQFTLSVASLPSGSCNVLVDVTGYSSGTFINTIPSGTAANPTVTSTQGSLNSTGTSSTLTIAQELGMKKSFNPTTVLPGSGVSTMTIEIYNAFPSAVTNINLDDYFTSDGTSSGTPTGITVAPTPAATNTCGGTFAPTAGATQVSLVGGGLSGPGTRCILTVAVVANKPGGGAYLNTIPAANVGGKSGGNDVPARRPTSATLTTPPPPTVTKSFSPSPIVLGATSSLTITLGNPTGNPATLTAAFSDDLANFVTPSAGLRVATPSDLTGTTCPGTTATAGGSSITMASGSVIPTAGCVIVVKVTSTAAAAAGTYTNTIPTGALKTDQGNSPSPAPATLTLERPLLGFKSVALTTDADNSGTITAGDTLTWTVSYKNTTSATTLTGVQITDTLPTGVTSAGTPSVSFVNPAAAGTGNSAFTGTGATNLLLPAGGVSLLAGQVVRVQIPVTVNAGTAGAQQSNQTTATFTGSNIPAEPSDNVDSSTAGLPAGVTVPAGSVPQTQGTGKDPTTVTPVATPATQGYKFVARSTDADGNGSNTIGDTLTWSVFYKNTGTVTVNNIQISDILPTGLTFAGPTVLTVNGTVNTTNRNASYNGSSANANLLTGTLNLAPNDVVRVDIPAVINSSLPANGQLDNQATLTATNLPVAGIRTDAADTTTSVAGITPPTGSQSQAANQTGGLDPTRAIVSPVVSGKVYIDLNNNGVFDAGEQGIPGATVTVTPSSGPAFTLTTDANGNYSTPVPVGSNVTITETQPVAYANGKRGAVADTNTISLTNVPATGSSGNNFGEVSGAVTGRVFTDANNDGLFNGTDAGIAGQTVTLTGTDYGPDGVLGGGDDVAVNYSTTTDANGNYSFAPGATGVTGTPAFVGNFPGLRVGNYTVTQPNQPAGTFSGITSFGSTGGTATAPTVTPSVISGVPLAAGQTSSSNNFAEIQPSSLSGKVFETFNNDNVQQAGEPASSGVTVTLTYTDDLGRTIVQTTTTAPTGGVAAGATTNSISINGGAPVVTTMTGAPALTAGQYYFGNIRPTQTGTTYTVTETTPAGFSSNVLNTKVGTNTGTAANDIVSNIASLAPGTNATGYDFADYRPVTISGVVFAERNGTPNYQASGDDPIQGATVSLRDGSGNPISGIADQTTPASGVYSFTNLPPGTYQVLEPTQPAGTVNQATFPGTVAGGQTAGSSVGVGAETPSRVTGIVAQSGNAFSNVNFGETFVAGISGVVYRDLNDDGQVGGAGETGIAGIRIELRDTNNAIVVLGGVPQVATTDGSGAYAFLNLPAGTYNVVELGRSSVVGETQLPDFFDGKATAGTNLTTGNGTVPAGQQGLPPTRINTITLGTTPATNTSLNNNFGEIPKSSLRGKVFETFNNDNVQQAGEPPSSGTTVTLTYTDVNGRTIVQTTTTAPAGGVGAGLTTNSISVNGGAPVVTTITGAPALTAGQYYFGELLPLQAGTSYTLTETTPTGFSSNPANTAAGSAGGTTTVNNLVSGISFAPGTNATGYDFADYKPVTISGVVFAERTATPNYQAGSDDPIGGATVQLRDGSGNPIAGAPDQITPSSGANAGTYSFTDLPPGTYQVIEPTQPLGTINDATFAGTLAGGQTAGSSVGTPTPIASTPSRVTGIVAQSGNTFSNVNFGEKFNGSISGVVFEDNNDDGLQAITEPALAGIRIELTGTDNNGNPVTRAPVATLADGSYVFDQLPPGTYTITEKGRSSNPTENQHPNYQDGKATPGLSGAATNGTPGTQGAPPSTISGIVLGNTPATNNSSSNNFAELTADLELSKTVDNNAPSIGGTVKFTLTVTNKGPANATGVTVQDVLPAGFTYVSSNPSAGVTVTGQTVNWVAGSIAANSTSSLEITATVVANQSANAYINAAQITGSDIKDPDSTPNNGSGNTEDDRSSVTVTPRGNINGTIFRDENGNGVQDAGEAPIPNVSVVITPSGGGAPFTVVTNSSGVFDTSTLATPGVPAGTYSVNIVTSSLPADYRNQSAGTNPTNVTVAAGENKKEEDNGFRPTGSVNGSVYVDLNGNGVRDPGEPGIPNVPVTVSRPSTEPGVPFTPITVLTDSDGNYVAPGVPTGGAVVTVDDPFVTAQGYTRTGGTNPTPITVVNGANPAGDDGFRKQGGVKEHVFQDTNGNGVQDAGEPNLAGVTVTVTDAGGKVGTGVTDANGDVTIAGVLEGTATVKVVTTTLPNGVTAQTAGTDPSNVTVVANQTADAGFDGYQPRGTLTGLVWRDDNGDGIKDPNEQLLPNVTVTITDQFGKVTVVKTDANGQYSAIVASGPVSVVYTTPDNTRLTTNNDNQTVTVPTGGTVKAVDVGYQPLTGGLTGTVFNDLNANGVRDAGEPGIPGATVTITDAKGKVITLVTDANGNYSSGAADLAFGPATVVVTPPPGYVVTTNNLTQTVGVPAGSIGRVPNVGLVKPSIVLEKNVVQANVVIPRTQTPTVNLGGNLEYQISVTNSGPIAVRGVSIADTLPAGLQYLPGTSKLEGAALADPVVTVVGGKQVLTWSFPAAQILAPGAVSKIRFVTAVTPETRGDQLINTAVASATTGPTGSTIVVASNASTAAVKVELGVFSNKSVIVGRVYFDINDNDSFEVDSDQPLSGARVYLSDGRSAVTDSLGRYSIPDIEPGVYTVRLDPVTAPYTVKSTPDMQGMAGSRYVRAANDGGITHEDFPLVKPSAVGVKSRSTVVRRGAVTLTKAITQGGAGYAVTITITVNTAVRNLTITDPLPANAERGPVTGATLEGNVLRFAGVTQPGTYTVTYALFTASPPDLVLTDPDINYEQIFTLIPSSPAAVQAAQVSDEVIR